MNAGGSREYNGKVKEMRNSLIKVKKKTGKRLQSLAGAVCVLLVFVCYQNMAAVGKGPAISQIGDYLQEKACLLYTSDAADE